MKATKAKCDICPLNSADFVPSEVHDSRIVLLAEAPGYNETQQGKPLVGDAGQELNRIITEIGYKRENFIYANAVCCRPTIVERGTERNRTPIREEILACNERLAYEIEQYNPLIIVAMGRTPYTALGGYISSSIRMADIVGVEFLYKKKYPVIVTYHPAAIGYSGRVKTERGRVIRAAIKETLEKAINISKADRQLELL